MTIWFSNATSECVSKRIENRTSKRYVHIHVHCSSIHNSPRGMSDQMSMSGEWINTMWYLHTMSYYSALKKKEILSHTTTQLNSEDIMLSNISQSQNIVWFYLPEVSKCSQMHRNRKVQVLMEGCWGGEIESCCSTGTEF